MGFKSEIAWTDGTFNPWSGCEPVSAGCAHCYAKRNWNLMGLETGERRRTSEKNWKKPLAWNKQMEAEGRKMKVFCGSICDVFDQKVPEEWREDLFDLIRQTPNLTWLLLTKRAGRMAVYFSTREVPANVWCGVTVENQRQAEFRIPNLLHVKAKVRFVSVEPMLGPVDLTRIKILPAVNPERGEPPVSFNALEGWIYGCEEWRTKLHWVICGGESGPGARPMNPDWVRGLRDQCQEYGVPFFFKQWGEWREDKHLIYGMDYNNTVYLKADGTLGTQRDWYESNAVAMFKVGKKAAGHELDGREWREFPEVE